MTTVSSMDSSHFLLFAREPPLNSHTLGLDSRQKNERYLGNCGVKYENWSLEFKCCWQPNPIPEHKESYTHSQQDRASYAISCHTYLVDSLLSRVGGDGRHSPMHLINSLYNINILLQFPWYHSCPPPPTIGAKIVGTGGRGEVFCGTISTYLNSREWEKSSDTTIVIISHMKVF